MIIEEAKQIVMRMDTKVFDLRGTEGDAAAAGPGDCDGVRSPKRSNTGVAWATGLDCAEATATRGGAPAAGFYQKRK